MGGAMTNPALQIPYADNDRVTMADRIAAEVEAGNPKRLDVASGYLSVSVWGAIGQTLARLERVRLLLGKDWELRAQSAREAEADIASLVEDSLRDETQLPRLPTPEDAAEVQQLIAFLERDGVEVRAWRGEGFLHAKAWLLDHSAGVGSANFTGAGMRDNRELVMWRQDYGVVNELRDWFNGYWDHPHSDNYKAELLQALRATPFGGTEWTPYQVLIRTLADRYGLETPPSLEQATFQLKWFQEDAVFRLIKLLSSPARGALLADAVGLGKSFMALGVMHHFLQEARQSVQGRPVTLIIPASLRDHWENLLDRYNLSWATDIVHIQKFRGDFDVTAYAGADLIIIDEAHRLRGGRTWFEKTMQLLRYAQDRGDDPRILLLTATPVNTNIQDLTNLLRILTKNRRNIYAPEIPDFERHLKRVEGGNADPYPLLDRSMVRRSRTDILHAYEERRTAEPTIQPVHLPRRRLTHETYQHDTDHPDLFGVFEQVLTSLYLAPYDLERFRRPDDGGEVDLSKEVEASSLAGLYMSGLLKRFESSLRAITISLRRLDRVLHLFGDGLAQDPPRLVDLAGNRRLHQIIEAESEEDTDEADLGDEAHIEELIAASPELTDPESFDLRAVREAIGADRAGIQRLQDALPAEVDDGKITALEDLLTRPMAGSRIGLEDRRVLVFTQFRHTAEYVYERLTAANNPHIREVALLHGGIGGTRRDRIARTFDPEQLSKLQAADEGTTPPQILVSTDVLAEGHNLQEAEAVVNFDLHWNPQVIVQRAGRVDRLNSPHDTVYLASFLPEEGLDRILDLVHRLNHRFNLYARLGLADEPVTNLPADQVRGKSLEQLRRLYRDDEDVLDRIEQTWTLGSTDYMRAPLEAFLRREAAEALKDIPQGVQSIKSLPEGWRYGEGVFLAFQHGSGDTAETYWRFYPRSDIGWTPPIKDEVELFRAITCTAGERRARLAGQPPPEGPGSLIDWELLRRAATELAEEITKERHTAQIARGASERSRKIRRRLVDLAGPSTPEAVEELLDRLEQVRIEDYDADPRYRRLMDHLRTAQRIADGEQTPGTQSLHERLQELGDLGLDLLGPYEEDETHFEATVKPHELKLSAYEVLISSQGPVTERTTARQAHLDPN